MTTAIVILNWNGVGMMRRFLQGVVDNSPEAEVIVADNGSTDESVQWLQEEMPEVKIIRMDRNYGFAEGYNRAFEEVEADIYVLLNSDVEVREGWLGPLLRYMEEHPEVAACQPKLLSQKTPEEFEYAGAAGGFIDHLGYPYCRGRVLGRVEKDHGQYDTPIQCQWATGACLVVRSQDYWAVGGLDERFFAHQEEIDLCCRLVARGRVVMCIPESAVLHVGGGTLNMGNPFKTFLNFRNNLLLLYKNARARRLVWLLPLRLLLDAAASAQFAAKGEGRSAIAVWRAWWAFLCLRHDFRPARTENLRMAKCDPFAMGAVSIFFLR